ncbi:MAG: DNA polymerase III, subunit gamma and tau [Candidatus Staskawiczbacteria bacterium RIFOXYB2_FULL_32_9]|uniref:DNA polymerase III subunit gamma/tau n=1 Tax=Candidatus Staskawiczbacteria bacterium RIFOXYD1_FULL_32_13 TaxID=1802234 RepID=A0A1G2JMN4_9BACT|nr:MAG: polymerase III, subunit gamma and tau protein [Parcubacteria group bacterium GW2011_GWC2_32_10]OGZ78681.1 MAG: DNA polymerase III, subunit gamma and tau [Candidatus Staskawiczbacteria bacterium RIFOXYA2_FULL_32_7]OGZ79299.1 MAG: DNA polymerase III, subunit gamma and tau [Candidatus Staskawiczbacteria bacterium RIFOXYB1_FULL_32_11]OGZ84606.1 MAG: DNA polymerase III, subunit gamma and tau [Candidatus Staskawiczbacteria bacterium RIFOXYB2_FULL_32_9]OGZ88042.1 MAG: DNA polymerase III, subun
MKKMNNIALYRKYRPQSFAEIIGQDHIVQTLTNSILRKNISHAYLFSGPRGSGKTSIARLFAKAVNCNDLSSFEPCNKCDSCLEISAGKSIDLLEIDAASHTGVDDVRELIDGIKFAPVKSKYKIFIIDECHQLSKSAVNALLKTLEEPPAHAIFLLATTESHKMLPTIISRCQRFDFKRLQVTEIIKKLEFIGKKENIKFENTVLPLIALNSRGSFRDAETLLDQCISFCGKDKLVKTEEIKELLGIVEVVQISQFMDFLLQKNAKEALVYLNSMVDSGVDLQEFAKTLVFYLRQAMLLKINSNFLNLQNSGLSEKEVEKINLQISALAEKDIQNMLEIFIEAETKMKYNSIMQLPLELAVMDITNK